MCVRVRVKLFKIDIILLQSEYFYLINLTQLYFDTDYSYLINPMQLYFDTALF